jgi:hypothetical protein
VVKVERVQYFNQPNCYMLSNGTVDVIVTTDIGPRVIAYRFTGGENILAEIGPEVVNHTKLGDWHPWGGHRLWHAPESNPRSYAPDNSPIEFEIVDNSSIRLMQPVEAGTGIEKEIFVKLDEDGTHVSLVHTLTNRNLWGVELAPWAITIVNGGGVTIVPNEPFLSHTEALTPARPMVLWYYTDLSDSRWTFGPRYTRLASDALLDYPQKAGFGNKQGWAAYLREGTLFVKRFPYIEDAAYPDFGSNFETYTKGLFMEVESLAPLAWLEPGESTIHLEDWFLFASVETDESEEGLYSAISPLVHRTVAE